jgi:predicted RNA binding protein YcfA (HicA-like mRNA interferase family)
MRRTVETLFESFVKVRELIRLIEDDGWFLVRTRGSHRQFTTPSSLAP